jgi:hypothetical protein
MGDAKPRALLVAMIDVVPEDEAIFNQWYDKYHVPERLACPGFIAGRRYVAVKAEPKYLTIYELEGPEALETPEYKGLGARQTEESKRPGKEWTRLERHVYTEIPTPYSPTTSSSDRSVFDSTSRALLFAMIGMPEENAEEFNRWSDTDHVPKRLGCPGFVSCRRFSSLVGEPNFLTVYELTSPAALETPEYKGLGAHSTEESQAWSKKVHGQWTTLIRNIYSEIPTSYSPTGSGAGAAARA